MSTTLNIDQDAQQNFSVEMQNGMYGILSKRSGLFQGIGPWHKQENEIIARRIAERMNANDKPDDDAGNTSEGQIRNLDENN